MDQPFGQLSMKKLIGIVAACSLMSAASAGPVNTERKSEFEKVFGVVFASALPRMSDLQRDALVRDYIDAKPNKGQAINALAGVSYRSTDHEDYEATGERTLEACQLRFGSPCALVAINESIVDDARLIPKDMPRLHYSGEFDLTKIPIIRSITKSRLDLQSYSKAEGQKAIAVHPWGTLFIAFRSNSRDAQDAALAACNADPRRKSRDGNCFVYAVNNQVVVSERRQIGK